VSESEDARVSTTSLLENRPRTAPRSNVSCVGANDRFPIAIGLVDGTEYKAAPVGRIWNLDIFSTSEIKEILKVGKTRYCIENAFDRAHH